MHFRKTVRFGLCAAIAASMLGSCSASGTSGSADSSEVPTVTIWSNGGQEVGDALQAIADSFNADPDYNTIAHVEIQFIVSGTNEQSLPDRLAAAYKAGETNTDFDLIATDDSAITAILAQTSDDFFEPIDTSKIPNYANVKYKDNVVGDTFIPYRGTSVFLAYNSDTVPADEVPTTADELYQWIEDHPGRFTYNDPTTGNAGFAFVANTIYNQLPAEAALSDDPTWETDHTAEWDAAFALLEELHPYLYQTAGKVQYPVKNQGSLDLLATGEVDMTPAFANMVLSEKAMGTLPDSIVLTQLEEPFMGGLAGFLMPTIGSDKEAALAVIDYYLSYEAQAQDWNIMYATPVVDSANLTDIDHADWLDEVDMDSLHYLSIGTIQTDIRTRWTEQIGILAQ